MVEVWRRNEDIFFTENQSVFLQTCLKWQTGWHSKRGQTLAKTLLTGLFISTNSYWHFAFCRAMLIVGWENIGVAIPGHNNTVKARQDNKLKSHEIFSRLEIFSVLRLLWSRPAQEDRQVWVAARRPGPGPGVSGGPTSPQSALLPTSL